ncbi:MAG: hypothetical protein Hals2KO_28630 [Halioglobus sp.]
MTVCTRPNLLHSLFILTLTLLTGGCSDGSDSGFGAGPTLTGCADTGSCAPNPTLQIGGERPAQAYIPADYTTTTRYPLVIVLHGFGANGPVQSAYMGFIDRVDTMQYVMVAPDGTLNENDARFWNATPACCAGDRTDIDDVTYIRGLIEEAAATYSIDPTRVGVFGHSNGGFMTLRMVCEASDLITSALSLAGSTWEDAQSCAPADNPVSVLLLHGDEDATIFYDGSDTRGYPGAVETSERFAERVGCDIANPIRRENLDVDGSVDGAETTVLAYPGCIPGAEVELWTIVGGPHIPVPWVSSAQDAFIDWLINHPRG